MKRLFLLVVLLSASGFVYAADEGLKPYFPVSKEVNQSTYASVNIGPYFRDTKGSTPLDTVFSTVAATESWHQSDSGYNLGFTAGWQFLPYLGVEGTWTWFEEQRVSVTSANTGYSNNVSNYYGLKSWSIEGALVAQYQVMRDTALFVKAGVAYIQSELSSSLYDTDGSANVVGRTRYGYWSPMVGAGVHFAFTDNWYGALQYSIYAGGGKDSTDSGFVGDLTKYTKLDLPITQRLVLSFGYRIEL